MSRNYYIVDSRDERAVNSSLQSKIRITMLKPMDKSLIPNHVYLREMKKSLDSNPIGYHKESLKEQLLDKWSALEVNAKLQPVFLFEEDHCSISAYAVEIHEGNVFNLKLNGMQKKPIIKNNEASFFMRKPMYFFDFAIEVNEKEGLNNSIHCIDSEEDEQVINNLRTGFNEMKNINVVGRHLVARGIIINAIRAFCQNMNFTSLEFRSTKKRVHFFDSKNIIVYKGIRNCLGHIFGIDEEEIQNIIERENNT